MGKYWQVIFDVFTDTSFVNDLLDRRSTSGYITVTRNSVPLDFESRKQTFVTKSTFKSETVALDEGAKSAIWLKGLLGDLGYPQKDPTILYEDNEPVIVFSKNPGDFKRTKHIHIRYCYVRELVENGIVKVKYVPSAQQLADIMTKPSKADQFLSLIIWTTVFSQPLLRPTKLAKKKKSRKKLLKHSFSETPKNICVSRSHWSCEMKYRQNDDIAFTQHFTRWLCYVRATPA
jgi:hypothetical protein